LVIPHATLAPTSTLGALATLPEEVGWLASRKSPDTRRVYAQDIQHFCRALGMTSRDEIRRVDRKAVIAWERYMREAQRLHPVTIRRRLSVLSRMFTYLVRYGVMTHNPVQAVERPAINRWAAMTPGLRPAAGAGLTGRPGPIYYPGPARPRHDVRGSARRLTPLRNHPLQRPRSIEQARL